MLLENKNAVIYGGGGSIGGAVARTFASEGANVFLAGRTRESLQAVASDIERAGGRAEVAELVGGLDDLRAATIGRAARKRVQHEHTYAARAEQVDGLLRAFGHGGR